MLASSAKALAAKANSQPANTGVNGGSRSQNIENIQYIYYVQWYLCWPVINVWEKYCLNAESMIRL